MTEMKLLHKLFHRTAVWTCLDVVIS